MKSEKKLRLQICVFGQVAEKFGLNDGNFSRKLRHELSDMDKAKIRAIIVELSKEVNDNA